MKKKKLNQHSAWFFPSTFPTPKAKWYVLSLFFMGGNDEYQAQCLNHTAGEVLWDGDSVIFELGVLDDLAAF